MQTPEEFAFPFPPYTIQSEFMRNLYECLENGKLGIFESPTGTGKTLSIICGAIKWLLDKKEWEKNSLIVKINELDQKIKTIEKEHADDWFSVQTEKIKIDAEKKILQTKLDFIMKHEGKLKGCREKSKIEDEKRKSKFKFRSKKVVSKVKEDQDLAQNNDIKDVDDYDLIVEDIASDSDESEDEEDDFENSKLFFCSRTHSQLTQFIGELKRSPYAKDISLVPLASRQNYCINMEVKKLGSIDAVNDRCLQMQKKKVTVKKEKNIKKSKTSTRCPFMPGNQDALSSAILGDLKDVEEVADAAKELETCSYYASRKSIKDGEVVLLPYNSVLHKSTRESSGINLKGNVLIIDEAHNLLEAIERMHSVMISGRSILHCYNQVSQYQNRFQTMFSPKTVLYLTQLSFCLKRFLKILGGSSKSQPNDEIKLQMSSKVYKIEEFEASAEIDTINVFELLHYVKNSKLVHKLRGFVEKYESGEVTIKVQKKGISAFLSSLEKKKMESKEIEEKIDEKKEYSEEPKSPLVSIVAFLESLKTRCEDGRIFVIPGNTVGQSILKFLLLNPAAHFSDIVKDARAVILAGGTMEPMSEFKDQLFIGAGAEPERIFTFSCDHIIPKENILTTIQTHGPTGIQFEFNFQNRQNTQMFDELGRSLLNLSKMVPAGIIVFLPSYNFEEMLYKHFEVSGVLAKLRLKKCIFREPKLASQVNQVLEKYSGAVKNPQSPQNGSLLFSVVGGKLSEGLNFSDDLGRCVVVVGMPYPNIKSPELHEKMRYLNESVRAGAGNTFYENSCMKAVNQCIGRAVRHISDYSTVVLLDKRYTNKVKSLPGWIQRTVSINTSFGNTIGNMAKFFAAKRKSS